MNIESPGLQPISLGDVWIGETRPDPKLLAECLEQERARHSDDCPRKRLPLAAGIDWPCTCPTFTFIVYPSR